MFWYLLKAEVYKDNWGAQNLKQLERKIKACVKKYDSDLMVMLFEGARSKNMGVMEQLNVFKL
jgi:hypothetical protein